MVLMPLLRWWAVLELVGLAALPLSMRLLRFLPERGVCFRRPIGLLLSTFLLWILVSLGLLRNTAAAAVLVVLIVAGLSLAAGWTDRQALVAQMQRLRGIVLAEAALFAVALLLFGAFRAYNPEIVATEKPMEFAFLNGILQSTIFPPQDPWLAGYGISYYYMGYVMSALLTRLSALPSDVTFNLTGISLFALTASGSLGLVYNLVMARSPGDPGTERAARRYGILGATLVALMGNLVGVLELVRARGWGSVAFWQWFDVRNLGPSAPSPTWYPTDMWWWWRASRVIHDRDLAGNTQEVISEFPFFSFLLGDNHPHVLALPFVLLALALALNVLLTLTTGAGNAGPPARAEYGPVGALRRAIGQLWPGGMLEIGLWGLILGALAFLNTWDYPIYLALFAAAYALGRFGRSPGGAGWIRDTLVLGAVMGITALVAYLPFLLSFRSQAGGIAFVPTHIKTAIQQYGLMFGTQLAMVSGFLLALLAEHWRTLKAQGLPPAAWVAVLGLGLAAVATVIAGWWAAACSLLILAVSVLLLCSLALARRRQTQPASEPAVVFVLLMVIAGMALIASVEFVYLRDVFSSRMNTVFKFYYQGWILLSLASAYGVHYLIRQASQAAVPGRLWRLGWLALCAMMTLGGLSYTAAATVSKANAFQGDPTLDGTAYVEASRPAEYALVQWLRREADPQATLVEAPGGSYSTHSWVSAHTGLPSLLGWPGHERQWRGSDELPAQRELVITSLYTGLDEAETRRLLEVYRIDYVIIGPHERAQYGISDAVLAKLDALMARAYENEAYIVYARTR
jgi:YYY domain-containing protein